jgi:hypothetical protein
MVIATDRGRAVHSRCWARLGQATSLLIIPEAVRTQHRLTASSNQTFIFQLSQVSVILGREALDQIGESPVAQNDFQ